MYLLGFDVGSSFVKACLLNGETGKAVATVQSPDSEMLISSPQPGWAEQDPEMWWENVQRAIAALKEEAPDEFSEIKAIGIAYQMHGLVTVDEQHKVIRPAVIWCDSRATGIGQKSFDKLGKEKCLGELLNSPGNFTASKLKWVQDNEPSNYSRVHKIMLPGDYIAMKLTGEINTTETGLSEAILYNYKNGGLATEVLGHYGISKELIPDAMPSFSTFGCVTASAETELPEGIPVCYKAGDQPNNAFSLNVLNPGETAATAGTSAVLYQVGNKPETNPESRVNVFLHVNHSRENPRYGSLLCINGAGSQYSWLKRNFFPGSTYEEMDQLAESIPPGSEGLTVLPFGNGSERMLGNSNPLASMHGFDFNRHTSGYLLRAALEGVAFAMRYGLQYMPAKDIPTIRAGYHNLFSSRLFRETLSCLTDASIELYDTDGATGAARAAGLGAGFFQNEKEALSGLKSTGKTEPAAEPAIEEAYDRWCRQLNKELM